MIVRLVCALLALVLSSLPAAATILPLLDEGEVGAVEAWWVGDRPGPTGPVTSALERHAPNGAARWMAPSGVGRALESVSRVLRSPELTPTNGARLAELLGAARALVGSVRQEAAPDVPWLGLHRTSLVLDAVLVDARTGAEIRRIALRAVAFGEGQEAADAAAAVLLARFVDQAASDVASPSSARLPLIDSSPVIVIRSDGSAAPYVAMRAALREVHPGVVDLVEVWATGGHVAMAVSLDEGTSWESFRSSVLQLRTAALPDVVVRSVDDLGSAGLLLSVSSPPLLPEASTVPGR